MKARPYVLGARTASTSMTIASNRGGHPTPVPNVFPPMPPAPERVHHLMSFCSSSQEDRLMPKKLLQVGAAAAAEPNR